jgi:hypothetical protein
MKISHLMVLVGLVFSGCGFTITPATNITTLNQADFSQDLITGKSCVTYVLGMGPFGSMSIVDAAKHAAISKVLVVEYSTSNFLVGNQLCVVVYGTGRDGASTGTDHVGERPKRG